MPRGFLAIILGLILTGIAPSRAQTVDIFAANPTLSTPSSVAVDGAGNVFVASFIGNGGSNATVTKLAPGGTVLLSLVPVPGDDPISAIAVDASDNLYVADIASNQVVKVTPEGAHGLAFGLTIDRGLAL